MSCRMTRHDQMVLHSGLHSGVRIIHDERGILPGILPSNEHKCSDQRFRRQKRTLHIVSFLDLDVEVLN
jgi:hypothetical protein